jgi:hypothetical protein
MKKSEIPIEILSAGPCFIGEYRGSKVESISYVDKTDGKAKSFIRVSHLFEIGAGASVQAIRVEERVPATVTDPKEVKVTFKRGLQYLLSLQGLRIEKGNVDASLVTGSVPVELS